MDLYVSTTEPPNPYCPSNETCHTLAYYIWSHTLYDYRGNVSLLFLNGTHSTSRSLIVSDLDYLCLAVYGNTSRVYIEKVRFFLENITLVEIQGLYIDGLISEDRILSIEAKTVVLSQLWIRFMAVRLTGETVLFEHGRIISSTVFPCYTADKTLEMKLAFRSIRAYQMTLSKRKLLQFCKTLTFQFNESVIKKQTGLLNWDFYHGEKISIIIFRSIIVGKYFSRFLFVGESKLHLQINQSSIMLTCKFTIFRGKNIRVLIELYNMQTSPVIEVVHAESQNNISYHLRVNMNNMQIREQRHCLLLYGGTIDSVIEGQVEININNTQFSFNHHCIEVSVQRYWNFHLYISISNSTFQQNEEGIILKRAVYGDVHYVRNTQTVLTLSLQNVQFIENGISFQTTSIIELVGVQQVLMKNCSFVNNKSTAVVGYTSFLKAEANLLFRNNTGDLGGALALYDSFIYLTDNSQLWFIGNCAQKSGGAIYVQQISPNKLSFEPDAEEITCLFQFRSEENFNISFHHNTAKGPGDNIYGYGLQSKCKMINGDDVIWSLGHSPNIQQINPSLSSVATNPTRVCLCDNEGWPQCAHVDYIFRTGSPRFPGEIFKIAVVVVGRDFGTVSGITHLSLLSAKRNMSESDISEVAHAVSEFRKCSEIALSIRTKHTAIVHEVKLSLNKSTSEKVPDKQTVQRSCDTFLSLGTIDNILLYLPVVLKVPIENCPNGFSLTTTPPYVCTCHPKLVSMSIHACEIVNHTGWIYRMGTMWISSSFSPNETNSFVGHPYCPYNYCKTDNVSISLESPDTQCALNRAGVLCGGCRANYSLALGTSKCLRHCDSHNLSLLLVFCIAGILLVLFIKLFSSYWLNKWPYILCKHYVGK